jgi:hypothetical protein
MGPVIRCLDGCLVDHVALRDARFAKMELTDARLNTWILGWVQHSLLTDPTALFDTNIFYPARNTLTQSEHMLTMALLTLPLRLFTSNAVPIHQTVLVMSSLLLALTTFALVRWLTTSTFAAAAAGAAAMLMPWRLMELSHVQLLNAQWIPLVWLLMGRIVHGEATPRVASLLALALTLQVLSSFYLAYYLLLSCAVLLAVLAVATRIDRRAVTALLAAGVVPAISLLLVALPYLRWSTSSGFVGPRVFDSVTISDALSVTRPSLDLGIRNALPVAASYEIPLAVLGLGVLGLALSWRRPAASGDRRRRSFTLGLFAVALSAFILALGRQLEVGGTVLRLPGHWAALVVPGFENLRNPLRWTILIGLAFPVLAGVGIFQLERWAASWGGASASRKSVLAMRAGVTLALLLCLPMLRIPVRDAWEGGEYRIRAYNELRALPYGPVMEIPWPLQANRSTDLSTLYMLGSTLHWRPLTNGMSGYVPRSYLLLRLIAQGLPDEDALRRIRDLVDVRWIVLHLESLRPESLGGWERLVRSGTLRRVHADGSTWILEIAGWRHGGRHMQALVAPRPGPTTLAGLPRTPLELSPGAGRLELRVSGPFRFVGQRALVKSVDLRIHNASDVAWPGLDPHGEGLVQLRYTFRDAAGATLGGDSVMLTRDIPPGSRVALSLPLFAPPREDAAALRVELVQRLGDEERVLPVGAMEIPVEVIESAMPAPRRAPG